MPNYKDIQVDVSTIDPGKYEIILVNDNGDTETVKNVMLENRQRLLDNQTRINNLENYSLKDNFLDGIEVSSIKNNASNDYEIVIHHNRMFVHQVIFWENVSQNDLVEEYDCLTGMIDYKNFIIKNQNHEVTDRYVKIISNRPLTGYAIII